LRWILELVTTKQKLDLAKAEEEEKIPNKMQLEENKKKNSKMAFDVLQQQTQK
jgi:hypothetical protein